MPKQVSGNNETMYDILNYVEINGTSDTIIVNTGVSSLPTAPSMGNPAFQADDINGITDGCCVIPSSKTATFHYIRPNTTTYTVQSNDFVGGRPIER